MKKIFLDTHQVLRRLDRVQAEVLMPYLRFLWAGWFESLGPERCSLRTGAADRETCEIPGQGLGLGAGCIRDKKFAFDTQSFHFDNLEAVIEPQVLGNRPARDKSDPQSRLHGGFDSLGRIQFHHNVQRTTLDALPLQRHLNHMPRARSALPHQQRNCGDFGTGDRIALGPLVCSGNDQDQFIFKKRSVFTSRFRAGPSMNPNSIFCFSTASTMCSVLPLIRVG